MYMFISFDPRALVRVRKMGVITSFLICKAKEWTYMFRHLFDSIDIEWTMVEEKRVKRLGNSQGFTLLQAWQLKH